MLMMLSPAAGITKWEVDRLYESGMGETFHVLGMSVSQQESGQWAALGFMTGAVVALASVAAAMQEEVCMQFHAISSLALDVIQKLARCAQCIPLCCPRPW